MKNVLLTLAALAAMTFAGAGFALAETQISPDCAFTGAECLQDEDLRPTPPTPAPSTDINDLLQTVLAWLPDIILEPLFKLVSALVLISSVLMLILRVAAWFLPARFRHYLAPLTNALHWLTWLLDRLALNTGKGRKK